MSGNSNGVSRRKLLKITGGSLAMVGAGGLASAKPDTKVEVNVGYSAPAGRDVALNAATDVTRRFDHIDVVTVTVPKQAIKGLERRPDVRYVEVNGTMQAFAETTPWGVDRVDAEVAHASGETGSGADIAIIDTGIDSDHPDLQANLGVGKAFVSCDSNRKGGCGFGAKSNKNPCNTSWDDDNNHGTHCAGIASAVDNSRGVVGVSTNATLHAVKVLDECGSGYFSDIAAGVEYVGSQGWDVGSMSLGGSSGSQALRDAIQYAQSQGVFLVAAAGNDGPCSDCVGYPAKYPEVMAVSSTNSSDGLSSFSSTGPEIEIAAPGTDIYSTVAGGYDTYSGTSMACPHVAGAAGQLMANGYTNSEVRDRLKNTAEDIGLSANESGSGLLDVAAALGLDSSNN